MTFNLLIYKVRKRISNFFRKISEIVYMESLDTQYLKTKEWFQDNGDFNLRLNYDELNENSIVVDLGGYYGQWTSDIFSKYNSNIYIFEPNPILSEIIIKRFKRNSKIKVFSASINLTAFSVTIGFIIFYLP